LLKNKKMKEVNCNNCGNKFEIIKATPGYEQKYCTPYCKNKAAAIRKEQRFTEKIKETYAPTQKLENTFTEFSNNSNNNSQKINGYQNKPNNIDNNNPYSIKDIIETKIENVKLQMELQQRNIELSNANAELTEYENEDNEIEDKKVDYIGELIKNPTAIISGVILLYDTIKERTATKKTA